MIRYCAFLLFISVSPLLAQRISVDLGSVHGSVMTADGTMLAGATVYALPALEMRTQIRAVTDKQGKFVLSGIPVGEAYISAYDEKDGYPYNFFSFFLLPGQEPKKIVVDANAPIPDILLRLGPKAAHLDLEILDEAGSPVEGPAQVIFTRPDIPGEYRVGSNNVLSMLVPAVPFTIAIEVKGYARWTYSNGNQADPKIISPRSGESIKVEAHLKH